MNMANIRALLRFDSRLGPMTIAASETGVCGLWFEGQKHQPILEDRLNSVSDHFLQGAREQVLAWLAGDLSGFDLPLDLQTGTDFQQSVWQALLDIPRGQTITYAQLGKRMGKPKASRAVGGAVGRNPLSIIVPCHRVVGSNGEMTGYAGGIDRKRELLSLEARTAH